MEDELKELLKQPTLVMLAIARNEGGTAKDVHEETDATYSYVTTCVKELEERGLIRREQDGRSQKLFLTDDGEQFADGLDKIVRSVTTMSLNQKLQKS